MADTRGNKRPVLVVDDDPAMRDSIREILEEEGHAVLLAENGQQALATVRSRSDIAVILLDLMMPVMTGLEFLTVKRHDSGISRIPVVLMTAYLSDVHQIVGVNALFTKPFDPQALLDEVGLLAA